MIYQNINSNWCRKCPTCKEEIIHVGCNSKATSKYYDKLKKECRSCCRSGKKHYMFGKFQSKESNEKRSNSLMGKIKTKEHRKHISESQKGKNAFWYGKIRDKETKQKMSNARIGIKLSKQTKEKLSKQKQGKNNPFFGKKFTNKHKENLRIAALKRLNEQGILSSYNPKACQFIDNLNKQNKWNLQHAKNGGEIKLCGYSLDGYDKEKNIIFEYDEKHHRYSKFNKKDLIRQKNLINKIKPNKTK